MTRLNTNTAPWPAELSELIDGLEYKSGWDFKLRHIDRGQLSVGLTLVITITTPNSYKPHELRRVAHYMPVPPAAYNFGSWQRWLLEQILLVERHEACEFFTINDHKPYAPLHGPGEDPYTIREVSTVVQVNTSYLGELKRPPNPSRPGG